MKSETARKSALAFIFAVVLLDLLGLTVLLPVQVYIVRQYSADALMVSMLGVLYAAAQFFAAPFLGRLSDRYGRRPVLLGSVLGSAAGYFLFGVGGALWVLFLSRLIDGFTGGNISTASAYVADVTPPKDRAKNFALIGMAFGLGFILGPVLGGFLSQLSLDAPAYVAGGLSLLSAGVGYFVLPESLPQERRLTGPITWGDLNPFTSIIELARRPGLNLLLLIQCVFFFVFGGRNTVLPVFVIDKFNAQPWQIAALFTAGGVAMAIVQGALVGPLVKRFGEKPLAVTSLLAQAGLLLGTLLAPALWLLYPLSALATGATGLIWPTMGALLANSVSAEEQGKMNGVNTALSGLMAVLGPLWAGVTYDTLQPAAPFWQGAILLVVGGLLLARFKTAAHQETANLEPRPEAGNARDGAAGHVGL